MNKMLIAAGILISASGMSWGQDVQWTETRFHRVFLRNGNVIDGQMISSSEKGVVLAIRGGEFKVLADQIDHVELVKMRSVQEKPKPLAVLGAPKGAAKAVKAVPAIDPAVKSRVDRILAQMQMGTAGERDVLTRDLARRPGIGAYLASQMEQMKDDVLPYAGRALWDLRENDTAPYLLAALDSDRQAVVSQALLLSGRLENSASSSQVRRFLGDPRPRVRAAAIEALRTLGDDHSLPDIARMMRAEEDYVRAAAINASLDMARKSGKATLVCEELREALERSRGTVLGDLLDAAGRSGYASLSPTVVRGLRDGDEIIRAKSAAALGALRATDASEDITQRLAVEDSSAVLIQLVRAAGVFKSLSSVDPLIGLLRSRDEDVVSESSRVLRQMTHQDFGARYGEWFDWWQQVRPR